VRVELIAIGSELLDPARTDTNGDWLVRQIELRGLQLVGRTLVGDDPAAIAASIRTACSRSDLVVATGGLGPTRDDRTREAIALACDAPLREDAAETGRIAKRLRQLGYAMSATQSRQAALPRGAAWLANSVGTASGIRLRTGACTLYALPGVPSEMRAIFMDAVIPDWPAASRASSELLKVAGLSESAVDERISEFHGIEGLRVTTLLARDGIEVHLASAGAGAGEPLCAIADRMAHRLGEDLFARGDASLNSVVGHALVASGATVATAESCTAGELAAALTAEAGASAWFRGGFVVYDNELKQQLVGVDPATLARHGAVSETVARELAQGARRRCGSDYGIGVTGIAGPAGGSDAKPVGTVHVGLAVAEQTRHWKLQLSGDRETIRRRTVVFALDRLRRVLRGSS